MFWCINRVEGRRRAMFYTRRGLKMVLDPEQQYELEKAVESKKRTKWAKKIDVPDLPDETRECPKCNKSYPLTFEHFYHNSRDSKNFQIYCRYCHNKYKRDWAKTHKTKTNKVQARWRKKNPDKVSGYGKKFRESHKAEIAEYQKQLKLDKQKIEYLGESDSGVDTDE